MLISSAYISRLKKSVIKITASYYLQKNADACSAQPWKEDGGSVNNIAQANAYEGFYKSFANKNWVAGGFVASLCGIGGFFLIFANLKFIHVSISKQGFKNYSAGLYRH